MDKVSFFSKDGIKLVGIWSFPQKPMDKAIVLAHGITVDKDEDGIFIGLAEYLKDNGFAVFWFDFRGHGESEGKSIEMTIHSELNDVDAAIEFAKSRGYNNIGLVGASFGGGISTLYTAQTPNAIKALCLWYPCLNYDHCFINPTLPWIVNRKAHMKQELKDKGWTTLGSNKFVLGKTLFDEMEITYPFEGLKQIHIPTIIIHGDKDTYVPYSDSVEYINNLRGEHRLITIQDGEHGFHDVPEHEQQTNSETLHFFNTYL